MSLLVSFLFFPSSVITNGIHSTWLCRYISPLPRQTHHLFLCSQGRLLNLHKHHLALVNLCNQMNPNLHPLFCLHIQHVTHCLFERHWLIGSPEVAGCSFCLSIPLQPGNCFHQACLRGRFWHFMCDVRHNCDLASLLPTLVLVD